MINTQAEELNKILLSDNKVIYELLSEKGKKMYFPYKGILGQSADAKGKEINATIGIALEEDGSPMYLTCLKEGIDLDAKDIFPYAPSYGKLELRQKWQELMLQKNPSLHGKISLPVVTNALTHALGVVGYLFVDDNDEIIITDKFWGNYRLIFENSYNGKLTPFNTFKGNGFDVESFRAKLDEEGDQEEINKKIVLLNFPNNPSGYTPSMDEVEKIVDVINEHAEKGDKFVVICDDAYFGLVYEKGVFKESIFSLLSGLHENVLAVKVDGITKEDYAWGLRVGFLTYACKGLSVDSLTVLEDKTAGVVRGTISNVSNLSQSLFLAGVDGDSYVKEKEEKYGVLKERYEKVKSVLKDKKFLEYFCALPFNSGYFMCLQMKVDAEKVRLLLLEKYDTGVIVVDDLIRVAYSSVALSDLEKLFENIYNACKEIK